MWWIGGAWVEYLPHSLHLCIIRYDHWTTWRSAEYQWRNQSPSLWWYVCSTFHFDLAGILARSQSYHLARYLFPFFLGGGLRNTLWQQISKLPGQDLLLRWIRHQWQTYRRLLGQLEWQKKKKPDRAMRKELALMMGVPRLNNLLQLTMTWLGHLWLLFWQVSVALLMLTVICFPCSCRESIKFR